MRVNIKISTSPQLRRNLDIKYTGAGPLRNYLETTADLIAEEGKRAAPVDLGKMRDSHTWSVDSAIVPKFARVDVNATSKQGAPYPIFVHEGTRPHFPPIEAITPWAERHGIPPYALALSIARKGTRANPWLRETVERIMPRLKNLTRLADGISKRWNAP